MVATPSPTAPGPATVERTLTSGSPVTTAATAVRGTSAEAVELKQARELIQKQQDPGLCCTPHARKREAIGKRESGVENCKEENEEELEKAKKGMESEEQFRTVQE